MTNISYAAEWKYLTKERDVMDPEEKGYSTYINSKRIIGNWDWPYDEAIQGARLHYSCLRSEHGAVSEGVSITFDSNIPTTQKSRIKFDDRSATSVKTGEGGGSYLHIHKNDIVNLLKGHKQVIIEIGSYNSGTVQIIYDLTGSRKAIENTRLKCQ